MNTAAHLRAQGIPLQPQSILCVIFDGDHCIEHTEATLHTWWANLSPEQKAKVYEADLDEIPPPVLAPIDRIEHQFHSSITACGCSLAILQADPHLALEIVNAAERLLKARPTHASL